MTQPENYKVLVKFVLSTINRDIADHGYSMALKGSFSHKLACDRLYETKPHTNEKFVVILPKKEGYVISR